MIDIIILAAGNASRMGQIKQLLPYKGKPLLLHVMETSMTLDARCHVVLGANQEIIAERLPVDTSIIINKNWQEGLGSSIANATKHIMETYVDNSGLLVLLADQIFITSETLQSLLHAYLQHEGQKNVATSSEHYKGVPAVFSPNYYKDLIQLKGDKGAKSIIHKNSIFHAVSPNELKDIDTPEDYENIQTPVK